MAPVPYRLTLVLRDPERDRIDLRATVPGVGIDPLADGTHIWRAALAQAEVTFRTLGFGPIMDRPGVRMHFEAELDT